MELEPSDFCLDVPEGPEEVVCNFRVSEPERAWEFLSPASFVRGNSSFHYKCLLRSPLSQLKLEENEPESRPTKSISVSFESSATPSVPVCKQPKSSEFFELIASRFIERPIWLKNTLIQATPNSVSLAKNHLKQ